jgi:hypothetical protein
MSQALLFALALGTQAHAGDAPPAAGGLVAGPYVQLQEQRVLAYDQVGHRPAVPEQPAMGPDLLAAGPDGLAALYDPVGHRVLVLDDLAWVGSFDVQRVEDIAFSSGGEILVLADRRLRLLSVRGDELDEVPVPDIVPSGGSLTLDGDSVLSVDAFGNGHPVAQIASGAFFPASGPGLVAPSHVVLSEPGRLSVDGVSRSFPGAVKVGGTVLSAGARGWIVASVVTSEASITVERSAWPFTDTAQGQVAGASTLLPTSGRAYVAGRDVAVDPDGRLLYLDPQQDGLHIVRVTP